MYRTGFRIVGAVDQTLDPGMNQRTGTHRARFNCSKQLTVSEAVVTKGSTGFAEGDDLGVGAGIGVGDVAIPSASDDASAVHHDGSDWDFSGFEGTLGAAEGLFHPEFVREGLVSNRWLRVDGHSLVAGVDARFEQAL